MTKNLQCIVRLDEEEREKAIALSREMKISVSALLRSVLYQRIPRTPKKEVVKALLRMGDARNQIEELLEVIPSEHQRKLREFAEALDEVERAILICQ
ncbi:plasmid mobilization protein (plasmid) [Cyanobacterium sp. IPPAS B-1200]|uniref:plasmid mobilization protein n=1 Tax=Cyanobacterium sp. IPPAS B-1200 TaxID=1562720 RepID=UPI0008525AA2|nr:hypothetical protein [Cyanobacterium sp. IPPAS B-1200]OEJ77878.1 hypothetical protein A5482_14725 [Cyanobacterium sp. IPPAS B-1200]